MHMCVYNMFFIHSFTHGHLGYFNILATVNDDAMNLGVQNFFFALEFLFPSDKWSEVELLDPQFPLLRHPEGIGSLAGILVKTNRAFDLKGWNKNCR